MSIPLDDYRQQVALLRYGLIADLVHLPPGSPGLYQRLHEKAAREYTIPGTHRTTVAAETLRDWLKRYRHGRFDALLPKVRADRGQPRGLAVEVADRLLAIKEAHPKWSVRLVIEHARASGAVPETVRLAPSTVHRLLARHGLLESPSDAPTLRDRRRCAFERAGQRWMSDVMHGPAVIASGQRKHKTYWLAFLDDATRVIPFAAFAFSENTQAVLPVFKQALLRRGLPERLYVDNGANFRSRHLALVCAKLGLALIHARPYQPQAKGKIERWFKTVRGQFLTRLGTADTHRLEALNRRLWAWVEGEYHHTPHHGLGGQTPLDRWAATGEQVQFLDPATELDDLFLFETVRKVNADRTVSLNGTVYEVDAALVGERVTLRYDPSAPARPLQVWHDHQLLQQARAVDLYANCFVKRQRPTDTLTAEQPAPEPPPSALSLRRLAPPE
jgi:transposase InsO family protein